MLKFISVIFCVFLSGIPINLFGLNPSRTYSLTPDSLGLNFETHAIRVNDSTILKAWKIMPAPADDKKTCIVIAGGDAGNMSLYVYHASRLVMKGYTVLTFDYRGFGESSYFRMNMNFLYCNEFAEDLEKVLQFGKDNMPGYKQGVWAFSMGTLLSAIAWQKQKPDFIIAEGLLYNPFIVSVRLKLIKNKEMLLPEGADKIPALYAEITCKMLVISGNLDQICTTEDSKKVCNSGKGRKLVKFKGDHLQGMEYFTKKNYGDLYISMIDKFV